MDFGFKDINRFIVFKCLKLKLIFYHIKKINDKQVKSSQ
jgi:hypothetical protein